MTKGTVLKTISRTTLRRIISEELPKLIEEDPKLRDQIASILTCRLADKKETDDRFIVLLEEIQKLRSEHNRMFEEFTKRLEEHSKVLEEQNKRLEEHSKRLEEHSKVLEEQNKRLEEFAGILRKQNEKLEIAFNEFMRYKEKFDYNIGAIGARWGYRSETAFRNALKELMRKYLPSLQIERYEAIDDTGEVFEGKHERVELDIVIRDSWIIVVEIKSSVSVGDILLFERKVRFFERREGKKVSKKVIISPMVEPKAYRFIDEFEIKLFSFVPDSEAAFSL